MSAGAPDTTVILSIKNEAHNLCPTKASATWYVDESSSANCQIWGLLDFPCPQRFYSYTFTFSFPVIVLPYYFPKSKYPVQWIFCTLLYTIDIQYPLVDGRVETPTSITCILSLLFLFRKGYQFLQPIKTIVATPSFDTKNRKKYLSHVRKICFYIYIYML